MKTTYLILFAAIALCFAACQKEIDLNYRPVNKLYVVTGYTNDTISTVRITRTVGMYDSIDTSPSARITDAKVSLRSEDGKEFLLTPNDSNDFVSTEVLAEVPMSKFDLSVQVGKELFATSVQLMPSAVMDTVEFFSQTVMAPLKLYYGKIVVRTEEGANCYYRYIVRHEGEEIFSDLYKHESGMPSVVSLTFLCGASGEDGKIIVDPETERELHEGDNMEVELQRIDLHTYNYLHSVSIMGQTNSNPIPYYQGHCLGYYHAYFPVCTSLPFLFSKKPGLRPKSSK